MADQGKKVLPVFKKALATDSPLLTRLHGLWGIGQLAQKDASVLSNVSSLFNDKEMEIRANLARTLSNHPKSLDLFRVPLTKLLSDPSPRVASLAGIALANHRHSDAVMPALALLEKNNDVDVAVTCRHHDSCQVCCFRITGRLEDH